MKILIFHGNFESERDWKIFRDGLTQKGFETVFFDLWDFLKKNNLRSWSDFIEQFLKIYPNNSFESAVGYSLGGRLLLSLLDAGWFLKKAVFLSTHTGLLSEEDRHARIWNDLKWKEKVLLLDWRKLFEEWNSQEVFQNEKESSFEDFAALEVYRFEIAQAFDLFSLGRAQDFTQVLVNLSKKMDIQWMTGEMDLKFGALAQQLAEKDSRIHFKSFSGAGHRIHRSNLEFF
jgi:2-succinyl-6-hydroxy-2,4-cyclohexadiene-1-carboxylate synthase